MDSVRGVGVRVGLIRRRRGLTQAELAGRIGRSIEAVSSIERGRHRPSLGILERLAEALDVPIREFFPPAAPDAANAAAPEATPGADARSPERAALYGELIDTARVLPVAELDLTVQLVAIVSRWRAERDKAAALPSRALEGGSRTGPSDGWVR
jgi:transcriptional regulator with XRE-family HTH domain